MRQRSNGLPKSHDPREGEGWGKVDVRVVLDEDLPPRLSDHLRARGFVCVAIPEIRDLLGTGSISDAAVCAEVGRTPSVLITLNVRDYADRAFVETVVAVARVSVVIVRVSRADARADRSVEAIHDVVHRHAHRFASLYNPDDPVVVSANRVGFRRRRLADIFEAAPQPVPLPKPVPSSVYTVKG